MLQLLLADPEVGEVRSLARRPLAVVPAPAGEVPAGEVPVRDAPARVVHTQADLRDVAARRALEGVDILYHVGAQVWQGQGDAGRRRMRGANVEGTRNVVSGPARRHRAGLLRRGLRGLAHQPAAPARNGRAPPQR